MYSISQINEDVNRDFFIFADILEAYPGPRYPRPFSPAPGALRPVKLAPNRQQIEPEQAGFCNVSYNIYYRKR